MDLWENVSALPMLNMTYPDLRKLSSSARLAVNGVRVTSWFLRFGKKYDLSISRNMIYLSRNDKNTTKWFSTKDGE